MRTCEIKDTHLSVFAESVIAAECRISKCVREGITHTGDSWISKPSFI